METSSTPESPPPPQTGKTGLLINGNYALLVIGQGISQFGDFIFYFTLTVWIVAKVAAGQSWAPVAVSAMMFSAYVPYFVVGPWAGVFVDRWNHRRTMMTMDALRALLVALMVIGTGAIPLPWHLSPLVLVSFVCVEAFLESTCAQFFNPASAGLIKQVVPRESLPQAEGLSQSINASAKLLGPLLGPPLYFAFGIFWGLSINALSFVISLILLSAIRVPQAAQESEQKQTRQGFWQEFAAGLAFSARDRVLRVLILSSITFTVGAGAVDSLMVFFLQRNLHTTLSLVGLMASAIGAGTIIGGVTFGKFANRIGLKLLLWGSFLGTGILTIVTSRLTNFLLALFVLLLMGILLAALNVAANALLISVTPKNLIGRVFAVVGSLSVFAQALSVVLSGYLAGVVLVSLDLHTLGTTFRAIDTIYLGVGVLFLLSSLYVLTTLPRVKLDAPAEAASSRQRLK